MIFITYFYKNKNTHTQTSKKDGEELVVLYSSSFMNLFEKLLLTKNVSYYVIINQMKSQTQ